MPEYTVRLVFASRVARLPITVFVSLQAPDEPFAALEALRVSREALDRGCVEVVEVLPAKPD